MENTNGLRMVNERVWWIGFANLFHANNAKWWRTKKWIIQTAFWLLFVNGMLAMMIWSIPAEQVSGAFASLVSINDMKAVQQNPLASVLTNFLAMYALALPVGAIIAGQRLHHWGAPIRHCGLGAFQARFEAGICFIQAGCQRIGDFDHRGGDPGRGCIYPARRSGLAHHGQSPDSWGLWAWLSQLILLHYPDFHAWLNICQPRAILGISLGVALMGPSMLRSMPVIKDITPWTFFIPVLEEVPAGLSLAFGQSPQLIVPIICTALFSLLFTVITLLRFRREEF